VGSGGCPQAVEEVVKKAAVTTLIENLRNIIPASPSSAPQPFAGHGSLRQHPPSVDSQPLWISSDCIDLSSGGGKGALSC
ncbi:hypothetical protein CEXT_320911, partial [Caerostris extrusa]